MLEYAPPDEKTLKIIELRKKLSTKCSNNLSSATYLVFWGLKWIFLKIGLLKETSFRSLTPFQNFKDGLKSGWMERWKNRQTNPISLKPSGYCHGSKGPKVTLSTLSSDFKMCSPNKKITVGKYNFVLAQILIWRLIVMKKTIITRTTFKM